MRQAFAAFLMIAARFVHSAQPSLFAASIHPEWVASWLLVKRAFVALLMQNSHSNMHFRAEYL
jgi:hypothetical protein